MIARRRSRSRKATIQVEEGAGGLVRLNGAAGTAAYASLVVTDEEAGHALLTIQPTAAAALAPVRNAYYDVQVTLDGVHTLEMGTARIVADVTRRAA